MTRRTLMSCVGGLATPLVWGSQAAAAKRNGSAARVDPKAEAALQRMTDYLKGLTSFSFSAEHTTEVVLSSGEKLQFPATSMVYVQRPNRMRSDRRGEVAEMSFFYDGQNVTLLGRKANLYASAPAPGSLDDAIDFARERLDLEAPAADLLYSDPRRVLMEDVVSGSYVGLGQVEGAECEHLAFRGTQTDWQIWIETGARPLPRRYVIVTKEQRAMPEFSVTLANWQTAASIPASTFQFTPPPGAERIEFLGFQKKGEKR